ncbi:MAG TPA: sulfatase/phosphatase domain-containing protein, partial [Burkholderiaceae bacterium]|nr:sulfatase/phosphatase domain-containing protein [Burkholderiaceae bacterium]
TLPKNFLPQHPFNNGEMLVRDEKLAPWPRTAATIQRHTADYYGMITHLDARIGDILQTLEQTGQAENTLIVFTSDNGLAVGRHGLLGKQNLYDHSVRVPLVLAGPGVPHGKRSDALCYLFDLFPTLCSLAGVAPPETIEGRDLSPVIRGDAEKVRDSIFGAYGEVQRMVRTPRWKLVRYPQINRTQLFDLQRDPDESQDLAAMPEHQERIRELMSLLMEQQSELGDHLPLTSSSPAPEQVELR